MFELLKLLNRRLVLQRGTEMLEPLFCHPVLLDGAELKLLNRRLVLPRGTEMLEPLICHILLLRLEDPLEGSTTLANNACVSSIRALLADAVVGALGALHHRRLTLGAGFTPVSALRREIALCTDNAAGGLDIAELACLALHALSAL